MTLLILLKKKRGNTVQKSHIDFYRMKRRKKSKKPNPVTGRALSPKDEMNLSRKLRAEVKRDGGIPPLVPPAYLKITDDLFIREMFPSRSVDGI